MIEYTFSTLILYCNHMAAVGRAMAILQAKQHKNLWQQPDTPVAMLPTVPAGQNEMPVLV